MQGTPPKAVALEGVKSGARERARALAAMPLTQDNLDERIPQLLSVLAKKSEAVSVRLAALSALSTAAFTGLSYQAHRPQVIDVLRTVATDRSPTLRAAALERLALENDDYARDVLTESLTSSGPDVVPPAKAIQLLGLDDHGEAVSLVRRLFDTLDDDAKEEAVRVLASDPNAKGTFCLRSWQTGRLARESGERARPGLQALDPTAFLGTAAQVVADPDDDPRVQGGLRGHRSGTVEEGIDEEGLRGDKARKGLPSQRRKGKGGNAISPA